MTTETQPRATCLGFPSPESRAWCGGKLQNRIRAATVIASFIVVQVLQRGHFSREAARDCAQLHPTPLFAPDYRLGD